MGIFNFINIENSYNNFILSDIYTEFKKIN